MPTRDLNDLLSSDEDEDDDGIYAPLPPAALRRPQAPPAPVAAPEEPDDDVEQLSAAPVGPAADDSRGPMSWLDAMPTEALHDDSHLLGASVGARVQGRHDQEDSWDDDEDDDDPAPPVSSRRRAEPVPVEPFAVAPLAAAPITVEPTAIAHEAIAPEEESVHIGDGIVADTNFVDDDWDD